MPIKRSGRAPPVALCVKYCLFSQVFQGLLAQSQLGAMDSADVWSLGRALAWSPVEPVCCSEAANHLDVIVPAGRGFMEQSTEDFHKISSLQKLVLSL